MLTTLTTGTGAQLWDVRRLRVDLYAAPRATSGAQPAPTESWGEELTGAELPTGWLGSSRGGSLTLMASPYRAAPAGFTYSGLLRQHRPTLLQGSRRVSVVAILGTGEEVEFYAGLLGLIKPGGEPGAWTVEVRGPHQLLEEAYGAGFEGLTVGQPWTGWAGYGAEAWAAAETTPTMTVGDYWKARLAPLPNAEWGAGADWALVAGAPAHVPGAQLRVWALDARAQGLTGSGHESGQYVTDWRAWPGLKPNGQPMPYASGARPDLPAWLPRRAQTVDVQLVTNITPEVVPWPGEWTTPLPEGPQVVPIAPSSSLGYWTGAVPTGDEDNRLSSAELAFRVEVDIRQGALQIDTYTLFLDYTQDPPMTVADINHDTRVITQSGTYDLRVVIPPDRLLNNAGDTVVNTITLGGLATPVDLTYTVTASPPTLRWERTTYASTPPTPLPPGLEIPYTTEESFQFALPGIHVGPLLISGLPDGLTQPAVTTIQLTPGGIRSAVRTAAIPYRSPQ